MILCYFFLRFITAAAVATVITAKGISEIALPVSGLLSVLLGAALGGKEVIFTVIGGVEVSSFAAGTSAAASVSA